MEARYRGGSMIYQISDPLLVNGALRLTALCPKDGEGLLAKVESSAANPPLELHVAFGGINGVRGGRDGDIGCERLPVHEFFRFAAENCNGNEILVSGNRFVSSSSFGTMVGLFPKDAQVRSADAELWGNLKKLVDSMAPTRPCLSLRRNSRSRLVVQRFSVCSTCL